MTPAPSPILIRPGAAADAPVLAAVYAGHVLDGVATFETEPPGAGEMARRLADVTAGGWPWLVAECSGVVRGYAYAAPFRDRPAWRWCLEDSVYLAPDVCGLGLGRLLLAELLARCEERGARQMLAVIGDSGNAASIGLHRALGFAPVGLLRDCGWKHGRWIDVVLMQRPLGRASGAPPDAGDNGSGAMVGGTVAP